MLIASGTSRAENRRQLAKASRRAEIPVGLQIISAELQLTTMAWSSYWQPCREFVEFDRRLVHRLVQLKKSWVSVLRNPTNTLRQQVFCWRYFLLLHQALRIARTESERGDPIPLLQRIVSFESFPVETRGLSGSAAGAISSRHPVFMLARLGLDLPLPTPRHLPLVLPLGHRDPFYCYRQLRRNSRAAPGPMWDITASRPGEHYRKRTQRGATSRSDLLHGMITAGSSEWSRPRCP